MGLSSYSLTTSLWGDSFLSAFNFFDGTDPSHGYVSYKSREDAAELGLYSVDPETGAVRLGVDANNTYGIGQGRPSVRLEGKESFTHGLVVADFAHMPPSQCGLWPAFWAYGPNWPDNGEVDIIEGANNAHRNLVSAHTAEGCLVPEYMFANTSELFTGEKQSVDCGPGDYNTGCNYASPVDDDAAYGDAFNALGGGVYAMEWQSDYIKIWHFARGSIPADLLGKEPQPDGWGAPMAIFGGSACDVDHYFDSLSLVLNINFCGDYGDYTWHSLPGCSHFGPSCSAFVGENPAAFTEAFWEVNYIDRYTLGRVSNSTWTNSSSSSSISSSSSSTVMAQPEPTTTTTVTSQMTLTVTVSPAGTDTDTDTDTHTDAQPTDTLPVQPSWTDSVMLPTQAGTTPSAPSPTHSSSRRNLPEIGDFTFMGCFASPLGFQGFNQVGLNVTDMTTTKCVGLCGGHMYAGVFDSSCYCADELAADTKALADTDRCDLPCPGDSTLACGGGFAREGPHLPPSPSSPSAHSSLSQPSDDSPTPSLPFSHSSSFSVPSPATSTTAEAQQEPIIILEQPAPVLAPRAPHSEVVRHRRAAGTFLLRRDAPASILLTVYANVADEPPPLPAPGMGGSAPNVPILVPGPETVVTVVAATTLTYSTVCDTGVSRTLVPATYVASATVTVTRCPPGGAAGEEEVNEEGGLGDVTSPLPTVVVPMVTRVVDCDACGDRGQNSVTITVPLAVDVSMDVGANANAGADADADAAAVAAVTPTAASTAYVVDALQHTVLPIPISPAASRPLPRSLAFLLPVLAALGTGAVTAVFAALPL